MGPPTLCGRSRSVVQLRASRDRPGDALAAASDARSALWATMVMPAYRAEPGSDDLQALERLLAPVLGDRTALRGPPLGPLGPAAVARLEALDRVIGLFARRLDALHQPAPPRLALAPALSRAKTGEPLEMPEPPELPTARNADLDFDELALAEIPPLPPSISLEPPPLPPAEPPPLTQRRPRTQTLLAALPADAPAARLLYEDILWLVSINDWKAAMVSIERLLVTVRLEGPLREFFEFNEVKLLNLFESFLGNFALTPRRRPRVLDNTMPEAYERAEKLSAVLSLVDGQRPLQDILRESEYSPLETCSALSQARRCGVIEIGGDDR